MCFAPQRRALFRYLNFQKWSDVGVPCTFWLENVLRATAACTFSTSQLPKVVRRWCVLYILTWTCASRHNGVQFFIHLASWLRTLRFSEVTFRPSGAPNHWENTVNRDFLTYSPTCIFLLLTLSLLWPSHFLTSPPWLFPPLLFHLSILSEVWLLNFLRLCIFIYNEFTGSPYSFDLFELGLLHHLTRLSKYTQINRCAWNIFRYLCTYWPVVVFTCVAMAEVMQPVANSSETKALTGVNAVLLASGISVHLQPYPANFATTWRSRWREACSGQPANVPPLCSFMQLPFLNWQLFLLELKVIYHSAACRCNTHTT